MSGNGFEPSTQEFSVLRSTTELPKGLVLIKSAFTVKNIQMPFNLNKSLIRAMFKFL